LLLTTGVSNGTFNGQTSLLQYMLWSPTTTTTTTTDFMLPSSVSATDSSVRVQVRTRKSNGTLLYACGNASQYISVLLSQGLVVVSYNLGHVAAASNFTGVYVSDGAWHDVALTFNLTSVTLMVDGVVVNSASFQGPVSLTDSTSCGLFVGGVSQTFVTANADLFTASTSPVFFKGCLSEVSLLKSL